VLELADAANDVRARIEALNTIGVCRVHLGDDAGFDDLAEAIRLSEDAGSISVIRALMNAGSLRVERGELVEGFRLQAECMRAAERFGSDWEVRWLVGERALEHWWCGRFDDALADADRVVAGVEAGSPHYMEVVARWVRTLVWLARDEVSSARAESAAVVALGQTHGGQVLSSSLIVRMTVCAAAGELAEAHALADEVLAEPFVDWFAMPAPAFAALGRAADLLARPPSQNRSAWEHAARARLRGENLDAAQRFAEIGSLPDEAEARLRAGEALLADGRSTEGTEELERALEFWRSVGAARYVREAEALLATNTM
jgi:hypothetical protein